MADIAYTRGDFPGAKAWLIRMPPNAPLTAEQLWLALRVERKLGDRSAEASYGFQLRRNFPDSPETQALKTGQYE
jgi:type IV pilus assembly protein PilF